MAVYQIQVSAKFLSWPQYCPCCGAAPDTEVRVAARRSQGSRTVRTTTQWWTIPYCSTCVRHAAALNHDGGSCCAGVILFGLVLVFIALEEQSLLWTAVLLCLTVCFAVWIYRRQRDGALAKARSLSRDRCTTLRLAVEYVGWHGTVHEFLFSSREYADAFAAENGSKRMSGVQQVG